MENKEEKSSVKLSGDIAGVIAVIVGVSFLHGYISYSAYLEAVGVEWFSYNISTSAYSMKAVEPFLLMGPVAVLFYFMLSAVKDERRLKYWCWFSNVIYFTYFAGAAFFIYKRSDGLPLNLNREIRFNMMMLMAMGIVIATYSCCLRRGVNRKPLMFLALATSLFMAVFSIPKTLGYSKGLLVFNTAASDLPYVLIDNERWSILDYQKENSLLIRYPSKQRPEAKFAKVEGIVIKNDSKMLYLGQKPNGVDSSLGPHKKRD
ncbi:hypothetical protein ACU8WE_29990 [Pseudomonas parakoreensis]